VDDLGVVVFDAIAAQHQASQVLDILGLLQNECCAVTLKNDTNIKCFKINIAF
jgi:hypothetical protein